MLDQTFIDVLVIETFVCLRIAPQPGGGCRANNPSNIIAHRSSHHCLQLGFASWRIWYNAEDARPAMPLSTCSTSCRTRPRTDDARARRISYATGGPSMVAFWCLGFDFALFQWHCTYHPPGGGGGNLDATSTLSTSCHQEAAAPPTNDVHHHTQCGYWLGLTILRIWPNADPGDAWCMIYFLHGYWTNGWGSYYNWGEH